MQYAKYLQPIFQLGIRTQLSLAFGALVLLLLATIAITLGAVTFRDRLTRQTVQIDGQLSMLANNVANATLLARYYEKDVLVTIDDPVARVEALKHWNEAYTAMMDAVEAFAAAATSSEDQNQAFVWRIQGKNYQTAISSIARLIEDGNTVTPQTVNLALEPYRHDILQLTDTAQQIANQKTVAAQESATRLDQNIRTSMLAIVFVGAVSLIAATALSILLPRGLVRPILKLQVAADKLASGDLGVRVEEGRADEFGVLARRFNEMVATIQTRNQALEEQYTLANAARVEAEAARAELAAQLEVVEEQRTTIREMSVPVLPLSETAMVIPLVGALDSTRLRLVQEQALEAIARFAMRNLILDITAVPVVDSQVAQGLLQVVQAARLMGTEVVLVGIRPEVAQTLVGLGITMDVVVRNTLQSGISYALHYR